MIFIKLIGEKEEEMVVLPSEPNPLYGAALSYGSVYVNDLLTIAWHDDRPEPTTN
jgi:hypothetical protein